VHAVERFGAVAPAALLAALLVGTTAALAQQGPPQPAPPVATRVSEKPVSFADLPAPQRFETSHQITVRGKGLRYRVVAGETYITSLFGEPIASLFSFSYFRDGPRDPSRPVLFVFNGGPGAASLWMHIGAMGPRRVVLTPEVNPSNTPPFGLEDNPLTLLDSADLVFIDPVGTGYSRALGNAKPADFFGVDEDADSIARFIERWLTEHGRWNSPKYLLGESYGVMRAAVLTRALLGGPFYGGVMRGITVNGVILVAGGLSAGPRPQPEAAEKPQAPDPAVGSSLPGMAVTAWYHGKVPREGRSGPELYEEVRQFATDEYAKAVFELDNGRLPDTERDRIAARLAGYTGIPAGEWSAGKLRMPTQKFLRTVLADRGLEAGNYDSRYTLPLAGSGNDPVADDPGMGRYTPGFVAAFHGMLTELGVDMPVPYNSITWAELNFKWNWNRPALQAGLTMGSDLAVAMRRTPALRVLVATGLYDMVVPPASVEHGVRQSGVPEDRVTFRRYDSGHMLYLGGTLQAFSDDLRAFITAGSP
jgi:carboxypeptidase C (cathepsin A)